jgi:hypothetical protein
MVEHGERRRISAQPGSTSARGGCPAGAFAVGSEGVARTNVERAAARSGLRGRRRASPLFGNGRDVEPHVVQRKTDSRHDRGSERLTPLLGKTREVRGEDRLVQLKVEDVLTPHLHTIAEPLARECHRLHRGVDRQHPGDHRIRVLEHRAKARLLVHHLVMSAVPPTLQNTRDQSLRSGLTDPPREGNRPGFVYSTKDRHLGRHFCPRRRLGHRLGAAASSGRRPGAEAARVADRALTASLMRSRRSGWVTLPLMRYFNSDTEYLTIGPLQTRIDTHRLYYSEDPQDVEWAVWDAVELGPADSLLDIGSGTGSFLARLRREGHRGRLVGLDTSPAAIEELLKLASIEAVQADAVKLPFGDGEFDVVTARHMLSHVCDPSAAVRQQLNGPDQGVIHDANLHRDAPRKAIRRLLKDSDESSVVCFANANSCLSPSPTRRLAPGCV